MMCWWVRLRYEMGDGEKDASKARKARRCLGKGWPGSRDSRGEGSEMGPSSRVRNSKGALLLEERKVRRVEDEAGKVRGRVEP